MIQDTMPRRLFSPEHDMFRDQVRRFIDTEVLPYHDRWDEEGVVSREVWEKAGAAGMLCPTVPEEYGGAGADYLFSVVVMEEMARVGASGPGFSIHSEMAAPYLERFGNEDQKSLWLPKFVSGRAISGIALTEPGAGSDLRRMSTSARKTNAGYVLNGQKVFISNGQIGDVFFVAAKTKDEYATDSMSLFLVEADTPGFTRGKNLKKIGAKAQDTSELFFDNVEVPHENLVGGEEGQGFFQLIHGLARERLTIAVSSLAKSEGVFRDTVAYVADRELFHKKLADFQNTQFKLAEVHTELTVGRCMVDRLLEEYVEGELSAETAAAAKLWTTEMQGRTVDTCLQLFGGWGYMWEYPVARAYAEARVERIAGGSSEVMKSIISKSLFRKMDIRADFS